VLTSRNLLLIAAATMACGAEAPRPSSAPAPSLAASGAAAPALASGSSAPSGAPAASSAAASAAAAAPIDDGAPRLTSIAYKTWIWPTPAADGRYLGYIRVGQSVKLRQTEPIKGQLCPKGFYAIEPMGYVCHDRTVTLERETAFLTANAHTLPDDGPHPYRFAISNGAPMYTRIPSAGEQKRNEAQFGKVGEYPPLPLFSRGHEHLAVTDPIAPIDPVPEFLDGGLDAYGRRPLQLFRRALPHGSMVAFTRAFDVGGRTFLLSTDLTLVPADRVRVFKRSSFKGTELGKGVSLPLAWMRVSARPQYRFDGERPVKTGASFALRSFVELTGQAREHEGERYLEVKRAAGEEALFVAASDATVAEDYGQYPFGVKEGERWIIVSITEGTLLAYEGLTPVYATLASPGLGGIPRKGGNLVKDSTTPLGTYRITFKDRAATMSPEFGEDRRFWIADVPFTQYFSAPFALHTAYWHEKFGEMMSGGCVNVSPIDGQWLFDWTDPQVPEGWQGATGAGLSITGKSTPVVVRQ
jgi:hypothetical protein